MATAKISKRTVDGMAAPAEGKRTWPWDEQVRGFGVVISPSGRKVYVVQYRVGGKSGAAKRLRIGTHGSPWTPDDARERALELLRVVATGVDPATARKRAAKEEQEEERVRRELGFGAFADRFIEKHVVGGELRSRADIEGTFDRDLRPWFGDQLVTVITNKDVKRMLAHVGARSRSAANKAYKWLSRMYTWGIQHDELETHPLVGLKRPFPEGKRDRVLQRHEIKLLVGIADRITWQFGALILLLLLTGQRLREVAGMRWEEIDLARREWIIPGSRTKNKRTHLVPLSRQVIAMLKQLQSNGSDQGLVLTTNGRTPISGFSKAKVAIDELIAKVASRTVPDWVMHDLRRTMATGCAELKVPIEHSEAILNHVSGSRGGVAGTYHLYQFAKEKRVALQQWADRVEKICGSIPVIAPTAVNAHRDGA